MQALRITDIHIHVKHYVQATFGSWIDPGFGAESASSPQFGQVLRFSSALNELTASLICVPRSVQWKAASSITELHFKQYQRSRSRDFSGRGCSMTMPTVLANRTGLWGVFGGSRNISPSLIMRSLNLPSSTTLSIIAPLYW